MANGTLYVDARFRDDSGNVVVIGRGRMGGADNINPRDIQLRRIKSFIPNPWVNPYTYVNGRRSVVYMSGSIGSLTSVDKSTGAAGSGNYVRLRTIAVKGSGASAQGYPGSVSIGTYAGSVRFSFIAVGE